MTYNEIKDEIKDAPSTYLPGLLVAVVRATLIKKVLKPGGAARIAQNVEDEVNREPAESKTPSESALASATGSAAPSCDVELAIALSRYVHDNCTNVPHDIGIHLAHIVDEYQKLRPVLPNEKSSNVPQKT